MNTRNCDAILSANDQASVYGLNDVILSNICPAHEAKKKSHSQLLSWQVDCFWESVWTTSKEVWKASHLSLIKGAEFGLR